MKLYEGLAIVLILSYGCSKAKPEEPATYNDTVTEAEGPKIYEVKGLIKSIPPNKKQIIVDHGDIPGFMRAMTMPFPVLDSLMIEGLKPADSVHMIISYDGTQIFLKEVSLIEKD